jgi:hypothetical protein
MAVRCISRRPVVARWGAVAGPHTACAPLAPGRFAPGVLGLALLVGCSQNPDERAAAAVVHLGGKVKFSGQGAKRVVIEIDLNRTNVTDDQLALLRGLAHLQMLNLSGTSITDRGLAVIHDVSSLKKLNLNLTQIGDAGPAQLVELPALEELYLIETKLTDACADDLARMTHLRRLVLLRTDLSPAAISGLRRALPQTTIQIEPQARRGS